MMQTIDLLIDLIENTRPKCTISVNTASEYEDETGVPVEHGCEVSLTWYDGDYQLTVTAPLCQIGIPEDGKGYNIDTLYWGGTSYDWDYYINVAGLSEAEEIALQDLMDDKLAWYDPKRSGYELNIEHY